MRVFLKKVFCGKIALYVAFLFLFGVGTAFGIVFCDKSELSSLVFDEYYLLVFDGGKISGIFFSRIANNFFLCLIFSSPFLSPLFLILTALVLIFRGFLLGTALISIISQIGVCGVLLDVFLILPTQILLHFFLLSESCYCAFHSKNLCLKLYLASLFLFFLSTLLVALFELAEIICIIRPLSIVL